METDAQGFFFNCEVPDEMLHIVAFMQGLHCLLLKIKQFQGAKI